MKEEDARAVLREVIERLEASKTALEDLRDKRRHLVAEFRAQDAEWRKEVERKREIAKRKEEEERRIKAEEKEKEEREEKNKFVFVFVLFYETFAQEMERKERKGGKG